MSSHYTIQKLYRSGFQRLLSLGFPTPELDAKLLVCHAAGISETRFIIQQNDTVSVETEKTFMSLLKRRELHEPIAYIFKKKEFYGYQFSVSPDVLIPRPETELLVDIISNFFCSRSISINIHGIDLGTGSGCISISLLLENSLMIMTAVDLSSSALKIAQTNALYHQVNDRLSLEMVSIKDLHFQKKYHFIVSNPPYIDEEEMKTLHDEVRLFEPHLALTGGKDGLEYYYHIAEFARDCLLSPGIVAVEIGHNQAHAVREIFCALGFVEISVQKDLAQNDRVITAIK